MSELKKAGCRAMPDSVTVKTPFGEAAWYGIRERMQCPVKEPKQCFKLANGVKVCTINDDE